MNLALFDFDGTITTRETFPDFMRHAVAPRRLAIGKVLLAPLVIGYRFGFVPGRVIRAIVVRAGFSGRREADIREAGERPSIPGRGFAGLVESPPTKPLIAAVEGWKWVHATLGVLFVIGAIAAWQLSTTQKGT